MGSVVEEASRPWTFGVLGRRRSHAGAGGERACRRSRAFRRRSRHLVGRRSHHLGDHRSRLVGRRSLDGAVDRRSRAWDLCHLGGTSGRRLGRRS